MVIEKAAPEWPIHKIDPIDRNILRLGLYELLFSDRGEVPAKVAINEAIELAKTFGSESSSRFVNGVLGAVYKELGEPGKNESGRKEKAKEYPLEQLGGAVVYAVDGDQVYLALVHDVFGHWTLSKGRIEEGEDVEKGTIRGLKEELGLDVTLEKPLGENEYVASHPEKGKTRKRVSYFLAQSPFTAIELERKGGLDDAKWFKIHDVLDLNFYSDMLPIVTKGVQSIVEANDGKRTT
jgi:ADP-ribose pyrophosphatase YjhB (NUDIX family)